MTCHPRSTTLGLAAYDIKVVNAVPQFFTGIFEVVEFDLKICPNVFYYHSNADHVRAFSGPVIIKNDSIRGVSLQHLDDFELNRVRLLCYTLRLRCHVDAMPVDYL